MEVDKIRQIVDSNNVDSRNIDIVEGKSLSSDQHIVNYKKLEESRETFKKPVLIIGPRKGHPTKIKTLSQSCVMKEFADSEQQLNDNSRCEILKQKSENLNLSVKPLKDDQLSLDYIEPPWSSIPESVYKMEVLKSGMIIEVINLSLKSFHVVGRLPSCDISMAHPTISRFHAILLYRAIGDGQNEKGMYIYDLGSTHGTFWNEYRIKPKIYIRLQRGHMVRFGCSQRKFILQAPLDDQEPESEFSVMELKEIRRKELKEREKLMKQNMIEEQEAERLQKEREESVGIDWGMGEDADEETDLTENPYAQTNNEELFLDDPKKTLRGWFEREGCDLQYQTEDKGIGRFLCWVDLPLDNTLGKTVRAEALVTGKKKEAVIQCALEACRILDRYGVLRQANHEARKRKIRNWEEEDYYDSDEDNFLDRTGTIEKKREQRMRIAGKLETKAETYDSLLEKHLKIIEKIQNVENTLAMQKSKQKKTDDSNEDTLDAFMSTLDSSILNKIEVRKMKTDLLNLRKEEMQLLKLLNIVKPVNLPPLKPVSITIKNTNDFKDVQTVINHRKMMNPLLFQKSETVTKSTENNNKNEKLTNKKTELKNIQDNKNKNYEDISCKTNEGSYSESDSLDSNIITTNIVIKNNSKRNEDFEKDIINRNKKNKRNKGRIGKAVQHGEKGYNEDEFREDYNMWVPPENQSGDGKTNLNEKFGY